MTLHRLLGLLLVASSGLACTHVKIVQREGCWVRQIERPFSGSSEEIGFCARPPPVWSQDRLSRLVQECMAQADYRWQNRALAAWNRGQPIPPQDPDSAVAKTCIGEASAALRAEAEHDALKSRLAEVSRDRDALRDQTSADQQFLQQSSDKMVSALGEAAKKPPPSAVATATSTGTGSAKTEPNQAPPAAPTVVGFNGAPATPVIVNPGSPGAAPVIVTPNQPDAAQALPAAGAAVKAELPCVPAARKKAHRAADGSVAAPLCAPKKPADAKERKAPADAVELVNQPPSPKSAEAAPPGAAR